MPFDARRPYNDLPPLPPVSEVESRNVLKACIEARAAVAELREKLTMIIYEEIQEKARRLQAERATAAAQPEARRVGRRK